MYDKMFSSSVIFLKKLSMDVILFWTYVPMFLVVYRLPICTYFFPVKHSNMRRFIFCVILRGLDFYTCYLCK